MKENDILIQIENQKASLNQNKLKNPKFRIELLKKLKNNIISMENDICEALKLDLNKSSFESYMTEIGMVLSEIRFMIKHCKKFAKLRRVKTPISQFHSKSYQLPSPYGQVLIISPWNYPFLLTIEPLVDAIAAGNSVVIKPSKTSANVLMVIDKLMKQTFDETEVLTITGGIDSDKLLELDWDYIFFTGSTRVGKIVMQKASEHFTPVTLELGGKSPCIVDETANIELAAKRIIFGKGLNAGQTCVAPDYILCDRKIKDKLIHELKTQIKLQYGEKPLFNENYPKIINQKQFDHIKSLIDDNKLIFGGKTDEKTLKIEPTIISATLSDKSMQEEIFGPVLPIIEFETLEEAIAIINSLNKPLAFYVFSSSKTNINLLHSSCSFGGGCINDTIIHLTSPYLPFGGIKQSGMGSYHGKAGFDTFTHYKSIVDKKTWIDLNVRYQPVTSKKEKMMKKFVK